MTNEFSDLFNSDRLPRVLRIAVAPDLTRAIVLSQPGMPGRVYWLDRSGLRETTLGIARQSRVAWSTDGQTIALYGNKHVGVRLDPMSIDIPFDLYVMPADCEQMSGGCAAHLRVVAEKIQYPHSLRWSPDSRWLAVEGAVGDYGYGIWLLELETGIFTQVLRGDFRRPDWSPDGRRLVTTGPPEGHRQVADYENGSALYLLDVSPVVGGRAATP